MNENMYLYTSSAFWWTPEGSDGLRHCARRFETSALEGTVAIVGGRACSAYNHSMISSFFCVCVCTREAGAVAYLEEPAQTRDIVGPFLESCFEEGQRSLDPGSIFPVVLVL